MGRGSLADQPVGIRTDAFVVGVFAIRQSPISADKEKTSTPGHLIGIERLLILGVALSASRRDPVTIGADKSGVRPLISLTVPRLWLPNALQIYFVRA